jgi:hypothetical protein
LAEQHEDSPRGLADYDVLVLKEAPNFQQRDGLLALLIVRASVSYARLSDLQGSTPFPTSQGYRIGRHFHSQDEYCLPGEGTVVVYVVAVDFFGKNVQVLPQVRLRLDGRMCARLMCR